MKKPQSCAGVNRTQRYDRHKKSNANETGLPADTPLRI
jgi:hypothetical protein